MKIIFTKKEAISIVEGITNIHKVIPNEFIVGSDEIITELNKLLLMESGEIIKSDSISSTLLKVEVLDEHNFQISYDEDLMCDTIKLSSDITCSMIKPIYHTINLVKSLFESIVDIVNSKVEGYSSKWITINKKLLNKEESTK